MRWAKDQLDRLPLLWASPIAAKEIGALLGKTKNSIIGKARRMKLPARGAPKSRPAPISPLKAIRRISGSEAGGYGASMRRAQSAKSSKPASVLAAPVAQPLPPNCKPVSILNRTEMQCAYVIGDSRGAETEMCGGTVERHSLCSFHFAVCWLPVPKKKEHVYAVRNLRSAA